MSNINLNLYRVFYVVAQSKSYSDAAEKLHLSVPSISVSINKLENLLNTPLFYREKDGVKLTEEGKDLFNFVEKGLNLIDLGEKRILQKNDLDNSEITMGCQSYLATYYLMDIIEKANKDYPNLKINLICNSDAKEMIDMLESHKIDFLIDTIPENKAKNIVVEELKPIHNIFISKNDLKLKTKEEFEKLNLILNYDFKSINRNLVEIFKENNLKISPKIQFDKTEMIIDAVKRGIGVGFVMKEAIEKELTSGELHEVKIPESKYPDSFIQLFYVKEELTNADKKFIKKYLKN